MYLGITEVRRNSPAEDHSVCRRLYVSFADTDGTEERADVEKAAPEESLR